ncbi:MAG: hypothetical protein LH606_22890 [Cytophagaceae bacterium]|nr:hypothetical protein [Cytophagaceae bacterium]
MESRLYHSPFFTDTQVIAEGRAPGRLDVMGGIADYSGSLVLQMPLTESTTVQVAFRADALLRIHSVEVGATFQCPLSTLSTDSYPMLRDSLLRLPGGRWAVYVVGCLAVLAREKGIALRGLDVFVKSDVPLGKGVSSSAALEVAALKALCQLYQIQLTGTELPKLAQRAENLVVGSPCGLMDQLTACFGKTGHLLPIVCQPDLLRPLMSLPDGLRFVGLDSGIRHAVSGASYGQVRTAAFMGYSLIARREGISMADLQHARRTGDWSSLPYGGFLSNISPPMFEERYSALLPEMVTGQDFSEQFTSTIDSVSSLSPTVSYAVRACTAHPVYENFRVTTFAALLENLSAPRLRRDADYRHQILTALGEWMYASHASYSACGLGNAHTDELVEIVRRAGPEAGVYGAKITGGGSGGTVCVLTYGEEGLVTARQLFADYVARHRFKGLKFFG